MDKRSFYMVDDLVFKNTGNCLDGKRKAQKHCKELGISEIYIVELKNDTEKAFYLQHILNKWCMGEFTDIKSNFKQLVLLGNVNANGDYNPPVHITITFSFVDKLTDHEHYIVVAKSVFAITKELEISKLLFDTFYFADGKVLDIYYPTDKGFELWKVGDYSVVYDYIHTHELNARKVLRERQKLDRLKELKLQGRITKAQLKELYRLEKKYA